MRPRPGQGPCACRQELRARHPHPHGPFCPARAPLTPPCTPLGPPTHLTPTPILPPRAPHGRPSQGLGASACTRSPWSWARTGSQYGLIRGLVGPRPQAPHQPASTHASSSGDPRGLSGVSLGPEVLIMSQESQGPRGPAWDTCWRRSWKPASLRDLSGVPLPLVSCEAWGTAHPTSRAEEGAPQVWPQLLSQTDRPEGRLPRGRRAGGWGPGQGARVGEPTLQSECHLMSSGQGRTWGSQAAPSQPLFP